MSIEVKLAVKVVDEWELGAWRGLAARHNGAGVVVPASIHFSTDPITGNREMVVFTDDGAGNGNMVLSINLGE
jgi:hypothetical protein